MDNIKYNISHVENAIFLAYVAFIQKTTAFHLKEHSPVTEKCHFDRYTFLYNKEKVSVVYDTKANILTFTAGGEAVRLLKESFESESYKAVEYMAAVEEPIPQTKAEKPLKADKNSAKKQKADKSVINKSKETQNNKVGDKDSAVKTTAANQQSALTLNHELTEKNIPPHNNSPIAQTQNKNAKQPIKEKPLVKDKNTVKQNPAPIKEKPTKVKATQKAEKSSPAAAQAMPQNTPSAEESLAYKDGFSIKNFLPERLDLCLRNFKSEDKYKVKKESVTSADSALETVVYIVEDDHKQKVTIRYMTVKHVLQLQGKRSTLFSEVQIALSRDSDYNTVVKSHIELTGQDSTAGDVQKTLKKVMPEAYAFMTERVKSEFSIGLIDLNDDAVKVSDYSSLLLPPFRALEGFIKDLQRSKSIVVHQLGQAYEKEEGKYILKLGYRRKIKSIVFNEVLSALYTLYFDIRNFYVHTDDDVSSNKIISDKAGAKEIFDNMIKIINYNAFKLMEIGFTLNIPDIKQDKK